MATSEWLLIALGSTVALSAAFVVGLVLAGRWTEARAVVLFIPRSTFPIARQLDDAILVVLALRICSRRPGRTSCASTGVAPNSR